MVFVPAVKIVSSMNRVLPIVIVKMFAALDRHKDIAPRVDARAQHPYSLDRVHSGGMQSHSRTIEKGIRSQMLWHDEDGYLF
jgi:hypothetical protein